MLRIQGSYAIADGIQIANIELRPEEFEVLISGRRAGLTVREFQLFSVLADHPNRVMQRPQIYRLVWGNEMRTRDRSVDVLVRKIRGKLDACAPGWTFIHTHFGVGYRFQPQRIDSAAGGNGSGAADLGRARPPITPLELHAA